MFSDLARKLYAEKIVSYVLGPSGVLTDINDDADDTIVAAFVAPRNLKLKHVAFGALTLSETGTVTVNIKNAAGTVIASTGASTGDGGAAALASADCNVFISKGQYLYATIRASANDAADTTGATLTLVFEAPASDD